MLTGRSKFRSIFPQDKSFPTYICALDYFSRLNSFRQQLVHRKPRKELAGAYIINFKHTGFESDDFYLQNVIKVWQNLIRWWILILTQNICFPLSGIASIYLSSIAQVGFSAHSPAPSGLSFHSQLCRFKSCLGWRTIFVHALVFTRFNGTDVSEAQTQECYH